MRRWMFSILLAFHGLFLFFTEAFGLRVASFNVQNYLLCDRMVEGKFLKNYPKPESEKKALRALILRIAPDVLALQEMGSGDFLKELQDDLKAEGIHFPYSAILEGQDKVRHTALLSKIPPSSVEKKENLTFTYYGKEECVKRGLLGASFQTQGHNWTLYVVHLKSKRCNGQKQDRFSCKFRQKEARAIADHIQKTLPAYDKVAWVLLGDLNDSKKNPALKTFSSLNLYVPPAKDSREEAWTYRYCREDAYTRNDFILVSEAMKPFLKNSTNFIADGPESLLASDHRLVYIDLDFNQGPGKQPGPQLLAVGQLR